MFNCPHCDKSYNVKTSLYKHERKEHAEVSITKERLEGPECQICKKTYSQIYNLRRHEKTQHGINRNIVSRKKGHIRCEFCGSTFSMKANLFRHWKLIHKKSVLQCDTCKKFKCVGKKSMRYHVQTCLKKNIIKNNNICRPRKRDTLNCPLCNVAILGTKSMIHHIELDHQKDMSFQAITFQTKHEYNEWKKKEEELVCCSFIKKSFHHSNKGVSTTLICNRSGSYNECATKRRSRFVGTKKINKYCPAQIKAVFIGNMVNVKYLKTHLGHDSDNKVCHMNLSVDERNAIIAQLKKNISPHTILKTMKYPLPNLKSEYRRIHLLTLRDIRYIGKKYGIYKKRKEYKDEERDRETWFEANKKSILFYKKSGFIDERYPFLELHDFVLILLTEKQRQILRQYGENWICIDSTNGPNVYEFLLTTVMVLDQMNFAYPASFMLSNKVDESVLTVLFQELKNKIGTMVLKIFMSHPSNEYINAWINVFPEPQFRFFSSWHVCRSWREGLNNISLSSSALSFKQQCDLKKKIYHFLKINLLQEPKEEIFLRELHSFLEPHPALLDFQKFFETNYLPQKERWAFCFWKHAGIDGNDIVIEAFHKILKCTLYGNKSKKLEKVSNLLIEYLNLKLEDEILEEKKGKEGRKIAAVKTRHKKSLRNCYDIVSEVKHGWIVEASTKHSDEGKIHELQELYYVQNTDSSNLCDNCPLICAECNTCVHRYKCPCVDYRFFGNMCEHMHLVCRHLASKKVPDTTAWINIISDMPILYYGAKKNSCPENNALNINFEDMTSQVVTNNGDIICVNVNKYKNTDKTITNVQQELINRLSFNVQSASADSKIKILEELARKMDLVICTEEEIPIPDENDDAQKFVIETILTE